ncbi:hypothetical protein QYE76_030187 [Lolium multiflorum]|uniref:Uncharacterized protein n=1 Tax=Lolium multiflorum TaxID=4521 RepID=A0AAD8VHD1_LOLMU|nr:hypothetical protein QYE76_030187 [Lolium multiflorum]
MDSDEEEEQMFVELMQEEMAAAAQDEEHMMILGCLASMYAGLATGRRGGSAPGRRKCKPRQRMEGYCMLYADYFADNPLHGESVFRRRFRMSRKLFLQIVYAIRHFDPYFRCKADCTGLVGFSSLQKCTVAMRMLAYGAPGDTADDYLRMAESTALDCFYRFCRAVIAVFGDYYLRSPTVEDTERILATNEARGNVQGSQKGCTVILEAVATHDLWIWHSFFGMPGSNNDINVLNCSPVFSKLVEGHAPPVDYVINGRHYNKGYYLADGIYPKWATFVKTISNPSTPKLCEFVKRQEACRKDVERAFGVLQQRFAVVRFPSTWSKDQMDGRMGASPAAAPPQQISAALATPRYARRLPLDDGADLAAAVAHGDGRLAYWPLESAPYAEARISGGTGTCIGSERDALLSFKAGFLDPAGRLSSWHGEDCCQWERVRCSSKTGHVVKLDLRNTHKFNINSLSLLREEMGPSLAALQQLRHLDLSGNYFNGTSIPVFLGSLENLRYLNLSSSGFGGTIPSQLGTIPSGPQLQVLDNLDYTYVGNPHLCGYPLSNNCSISTTDAEKSVHGVADHITYLYLGMGIGFGVGLSTVFCTMLLRRTWASAYFQIIDKLYDEGLERSEEGPPEATSWSTVTMTEGSGIMRRGLVGSRAPTCTYNECRGCRYGCSAHGIPVDASDPMNSAYHYRCFCHI